MLTNKVVKHLAEYAGDHYLARRVHHLPVAEMTAEPIVQCCKHT